MPLAATWVLLSSFSIIPLKMYSVVPYMTFVNFKQM